MSIARKMANDVLEGFKMTSSTQEVEITHSPWKEVIEMQKIMLKANPQLTFDVIEAYGIKGVEKYLLVYKAAMVASNVYHVDFKNKTIISKGSEAYKDNK